LIELDLSHIFVGTQFLIHNETVCINRLWVPPPQKNAHGPRSQHQKSLEINSGREMLADVQNCLFETFARPLKLPEPQIYKKIKYLYPQRKPGGERSRNTCRNSESGYSSRPEKFALLSIWAVFRFLGVSEITSTHNMQRALNS